MKKLIINLLFVALMLSMVSSSQTNRDCWSSIYNCFQKVKYNICRKNQITLIVDRQQINDEIQNRYTQRNSYLPISMLNNRKSKTIDTVQTSLKKNEIEQIQTALKENKHEELKQILDNINDYLFQREMDFFGITLYNLFAQSAYDQLVNPDVINYVHMDSLKILISKMHEIDPKKLIESLMMTNDEGQTILHHIMNNTRNQERQRAVMDHLFTYMKNINQQSVGELIMKQENSLGHTVLAQATNGARYNIILEFLLDTLKETEPENFIERLMDVNEKHDSILHVLFDLASFPRPNQLDTLRIILSKIDQQENKIKLITKQQIHERYDEKSNCSLLHMAVYGHQERDFVRALLDVFTVNDAQNLVDFLIVKSNPQKALSEFKIGGGTALHFYSRRPEMNEYSEALLTKMQEMNPEKLFEFVAEENSKQLNVLDLAAAHENIDLLNRVLNFFHSENVLDLVLKTNAEKDYIHAKGENNANSMDIAYQLEKIEVQKILLKKILNILHKMQENNPTQFWECVPKNTNLRSIVVVNVFPPNARERSVSELLFQAALENDGWFIVLTKKNDEVSLDESPASFWLKFMRDGKNKALVKKIILKYLIWNTTPHEKKDYLARAMKPMELVWKQEKKEKGI